MGTSRTPVADFPLLTSQLQPAPPPRPWHSTQGSCEFCAGGGGVEGGGRERGEERVSRGATLGLCPHPSATGTHGRHPSTVPSHCTDPTHPR